MTMLIIITALALILFGAFVVFEKIKESGLADYGSSLKAASLKLLRFAQGYAYHEHKYVFQIKMGFITGLGHHVHRVFEGTVLSLQ